MIRDLRCISSSVVVVRWLPDDTQCVVMTANNNNMLLALSCRRASSPNNPPMSFFFVARLGGNPGRWRRRRRQHQHVVVRSSIACAAALIFSPQAAIPLLFRGQARQPSEPHALNSRGRSVARKAALHPHPLRFRPAGNAGSYVPARKRGQLRRAAANQALRRSRRGRRAGTVDCCGTGGGGGGSTQLRECGLHGGCLESMDRRARTAAVVKALPHKSTGARALGAHIICRKFFCRMRPWRRSGGRKGAHETRQLTVQF